MTTTYTKATKPITSFGKEVKTNTTYSKEQKPGSGVAYYIWDNISGTWSSNTETWDNTFGTIPATVYTKEIKP